VLVVFACVPAAVFAQEHPVESGAERRLGHVIVGAGPSWAEIGEPTVDPAAMLGLDFALGRNVRLGLVGDITFGNDGFRRTRVFAGPELTIVPYATGMVRPYLTGNLVGSFVDDTGYGYGVGLGAFVVPDVTLPIFVDLRTYHIQDMESSPYDQMALRAGIVF
jgi:hypothetical protein